MKIVRTICVFTGTRAEYGLLSSLMNEIRKDQSLKLQVIVSAMHLSSEFGNTYKEIEKDRYHIDAKVRIFLDTDDRGGMAKAIASGIVNISKTIKRLRPDLIVILGDRFEAYAAAIAAMTELVPIAHIHGGESTFGMLDEAIRHSITKMSHLHFTAAELYKRRVIQMGERPDRVFNVGALGIDNIKTLKILPRKELEKELRFKFNKHNLLVTFHPVTLEDKSSEQFRNLLEVLNGLSDTNIIFTKANSDPGGRLINKMIDRYAAKNRKKAIVFKSMGHSRYLSAMAYMDAVVGNSSSGIIEAPSLKVGTINIGCRQDGRIRAKSVIDCGTTKKDIIRAFRRLYSRNFQDQLKRTDNPYGSGKTAAKIKNVLKKYPLNDLLKKKFYDI